MISSDYLTRLVLPVEDGPYTNRGGEPAAPATFSNAWTCSALPGQRFSRPATFMRARAFALAYKGAVTASAITTEASESAVHSP